MASRAEGWVPGTRVRFGNLSFVIAIDGSLVQVQTPVRLTSDGIVGTMQGPHLESQRQDTLAVSNPSIFNNACLECQLQSFLGPQPTEGDLHCVAYSHANMATQLSGGSPIPPEVLFDRTTMMFPFGMGNVVRHVQHYVALYVPNHYGGGGLVRMTEFSNDSDDDLLADDSLLGSDTGSCTGSHHPSLECFATGTPDGYVEEAEDSPRHSRDRTPTPIPPPVQEGSGPVQPPPALPSG